jgi:hypothetical protein
MFSKYKSDWAAIFYFVAGMLAGLVPALVFFWTLFIFLFGLYRVLAGAQHAYKYAGFLVGMELLMRMSGSGIPHEFTKYAVSVLLLAEMLVRKFKFNTAIIIYVLMLLPAIFLVQGRSLEESRQLVSANLSGPFCLAISVLYFNRLPISYLKFKSLMLTLLFPLVATLGYLFVKTPDLSTVDFGYDSNFQASIYGPNQMSSILGLGIIIIGFAYLVKVKLFGSYIVALVFMTMFAFRALLTFSRGGVITAAIILLIVAIFLGGKSLLKPANFFRTIFLTVGVSLIFWFTFQYTNSLTGEALYKRYAGIREDKQVESLEEITSGRTTIMLLDLQIFADHPIMGIGVGMGKFFRQQYGYSVKVAAHNEFTRLLAEHGAFGLVALGILILMPINRFFKSRSLLQRVVMLVGIGFCFVFMSHSATRLAAPGFLYGMSFILFVNSSARSSKRTEPLEKNHEVVNADTASN